MAKRYRPVNRDQPFLLPPDMREWLPEGHPVHLVIAADYDPDMLVALLLWAYAQGVTSSRRIEAACWSDVAFRVICAGDRSEETLRKLAAETVAAHAAADAAEDELYGPGARGDEVPAEAADPRTRAGRIAAALAGLEAERQAAEAAAREQGQEYLAEAAGGHQRGNVPSAMVAAAAGRAGRGRAAAGRGRPPAVPGAGPFPGAPRGGVAGQSRGQGRRGGAEGRRAREPAGAE